MFKRLIKLSMLLLFGFTLTACGNDEPDLTGYGTDETDESQEVKREVTPDETVDSLVNPFSKKDKNK